MTQSRSTTPIALLGAVFNPVHNGHLAIAALARSFFKIDKVYFVPSGNPPHKTENMILSAKHRLAMLRLAIDGCDSFSVYDEEIRRGGVSYTVDTILSIRKQFPETPLYFIIGSDNLGEIVTWHRYKDICENVTLCVTSRPGYPMTVPQELADADIKIFPSPDLTISSSLIRKNIALGLNCEHLLPAGVADYIKKNKLYYV
jgi:nicotinate-nucleotide adenylyltransferase